MYAFHAGLGTLKELREFIKEEGIEELQLLMNILYTIQDSERRDAGGIIRA